MKENILRAETRRPLTALGLLLIAALPFWMALAVPALTRLPVDFQFRGDVFSLDNLYDEHRQLFIGSNISSTAFSYQVVSSQGNILLVRNVFDVRQMTGEEIFSTERLYAINARTGGHVLGHGDRDRTGYLFAPRRAGRRDYVYWHVSYDAPAHMEFRERERIEGLVVHHFAAGYTADQTKELNGLPGVPDARGIITVVNLDLWVEPISGMMVKYEDSAVAYYYDMATGERLHPWNSFSNRFTKSSIAERVTEARGAKWRILVLDRVVPGIVLGVGLVLAGLGLGLCSWTRPYRLLSRVAGKLSRRILLIGTVSLLTVVVVFGIVISVNSFGRKTLTVAIAPWVSNDQFKENIRGFKEALARAGFREGVDIRFLTGNAEGDPRRQLELLEEFVDARVDLIYSLTTPGTLVAKGVTTRIPIVFSIVSYPSEVGIIASPGLSGGNIVGTRNYVSPSRQYYAFERIYPGTPERIAFVHRLGEPNSTIQFGEYRDILTLRGIQIVEISAVDLEDMRSQLGAIMPTIDAVVSACDTLIQSGGEEIVIDLAREYGKPVLSCNRDGVRNGALVAVVSDFYALGMASGEKASLILKGAEPKWLRTESPREYYTIVNLNVARQLGYRVPPDVLRESSETIGE